MPKFKPMKFSQLSRLLLIFYSSTSLANVQNPMSNSHSTQRYAHYLNPTAQLDFAASESLLQRGAVTIFVEVLPASTNFLRHPFWQTNSQFVDLAKDINAVNRKLHVVVTKVQYQVKVPIEFFTDQRLKDLDFNKAWGGNTKLEKLNSHTFRNPGSGSAPGYDQVMDVYIGESEISEKVSQFLNLNKDRGAPELIRYIRNTNYTKLLGQNTSYSNQMVTAFFRSPTKPNETIIVEDAVTYLYNVPPAIVGGVGRLRKNIQEAFFDSAKRLEQMSVAWEITN